MSGHDWVGIPAARGVLWTCSRCQGDMYLDGQSPPPVLKRVNVYAEDESLLSSEKLSCEEAVVLRIQSS